VSAEALAELGLLVMGAKDKKDAPANLCIKGCMSM
jgi:hypothetical protein